MRRVWEATTAAGQAAPGLVAWQEGLEGTRNARATLVSGWTGVHPTCRTGFRDP